MPSLPNKIAIIVLNYSQKELTRACVQSLEKIKDPNYEIIIVDNGSTDGSVAMIQTEFPHHLLLENRENLGYAEGNNRGIELALARNAEFILILNNDTTVEPNILRSFRKSAADHPRAGIFGAKVLCFDNPSLLDHLGGVWNEKKAMYDLIGHREKSTSYPENIPLDYLCGCSLFVRRSTLETIGLFDSRFFLFWEEGDLCWRAKKQNIDLHLCPDIQIIHHGSASFTGKPHTSYYWWRGRLQWIAKNCPQKRTLYRKVLVKEIFRLAKHRYLLSLQLLLFGKKEKREKLLQKKAALQGVFDHFRKRYGRGPSWISKVK